ncbi:hypothetical protein ACKC5Q_23520, partial [Aeromonas dhakensis]|uniref:hypothetical protein n=1 Tax=Aeromonas dhakensis TaxID=196024 RepID=UPI0038B5513D
KSNPQFDSMPLGSGSLFLIVTYLQGSAFSLLGFTRKGGAGVVRSPVRVVSFGVCLGHPFAGGRMVTEGLLP